MISVRKSLALKQLKNLQVVASSSQNFSSFQKRGLTQLRKLKQDIPKPDFKTLTGLQSDWEPKQTKAHTFRRVLIRDSNITVEVCKGDITTESTDAIVCPAGNFLNYDGGVAACILKRGGKCIAEETDDIVAEKKMIPTGGVEVTTAGRLDPKYIIHAVGPNMNCPSQLGLDKNKLLIFAINNTLEMAEEELECKSISIPAIASGSFGFPKDRCAKIMFDCILKFAEDQALVYENPSLQTVRFVNNDEKTVEAFLNEFDKREL